MLMRAAVIRLSAAAPLMRVIAGFEQLGEEVGKSGLSAGAKADLRARLEEKTEQAHTRRTMLWT